MPVLTIQTNIAAGLVTDDLLKQLSAKVAKAVGKPEQYVAVHVSPAQKLFFSGTNEPAAVMELTSIGLPSGQTANLSKEIMTFLEDKLNIPADRMYLKFTNVSGNMFGWSKGTF